MMKEIVRGRSKSHHLQFAALLKAPKRKKEKKNQTANSILTQTVSTECGQREQVLEASGKRPGRSDSSVRQAFAEDE